MEMFSEVEKKNILDEKSFFFLLPIYLFFLAQELFPCSKRKILRQDKNCFDAIKKECLVIRNHFCGMKQFHLQDSSRKLDNEIQRAFQWLSIRRVDDQNATPPSTAGRKGGASVSGPAPRVSGGGGEKIGEPTSQEATPLGEQWPNRWGDPHHFWRGQLGNHGVGAWGGALEDKGSAPINQFV